MLGEAGIQRLVVVVDDLDRCLPAVAIDTLEALRLFLFVEGTAFIIAADEALIEYAVRQHFPGLPYSEGPAAFTRNYLEKLIQVPFRLPPMNADEAKAYVALLFVEAALRDTPDTFQKMLDSMLATRDKPWLPLRVDLSAVQKNLPMGTNVDAHLREQLLIAERVSRPLATGSKGNPRQIKRFLNTLMLRMRLASAYKMVSSVNDAILAKLMLLERFSPVLYRGLVEAVRASSTGQVAGIDRSAEPGEGESPSALPEALAKSTAFYEWARLEPHLADVDLRPYLFISREYAPGYVGESSYPDVPQELVKRVLNASQFDETLLERDLALLSGERAERLFDIALAELRMRTQLRDLDSAPLRGLAALVRAHKHLQTPYIEAIDSFPTKNVGPFMPLHMRAAITESESQSRLNVLEQRWSEEGDSVLKEAVIVARRPSPKR